MQKLLQQLRLILLGLVASGILIACQTTARVEPSPTAETPVAQQTPATNTTNTGSIQLPPLPYDYAALEPYIDAATMRLHHDNHHAAYVKNLNEALQKYPNLQNRPVDELVRDVNSLPEDIRTAVRNNGGGHVNHTMFWEIMAPNAGGQPTGAIAQAINQRFGSFENFQKQFNAAGGDRFGSGWVWLIRNAQGQLDITTTPNQDTPLMDGTYPIMGNDVWEHAYYLQYRNRRAEYLNRWWNVVNWERINQRFAQANQTPASSPS